MIIKLALGAALCMSFAVNAMQQPTIVQKIRKGSARVRVTVINKTQKNYIFQGWREGSRGPKKIRQGNKKSPAPLLAIPNKEGESSRFHIAFGKRDLSQIESQEVEILDQSAKKLMLTFSNTIEILNDGTLKYAGIVKGPTLESPQKLSLTIPRPANTAAEIALYVVLKGEDLEFCYLEPIWKPGIKIL